jgi:hypothetical protein
VTAKVLPDGRILEHNPPPWMKPWALRLKARLDLLVPPWCLDHGWMKGRRQEDAEAMVEEGWQYCDVKHCFASISQDRLWWLLRSQPELRNDLQRFFARMSCDRGVPEGCSFSPTLANLYMAATDRRWQRRAVRVGDNWASSNRDHLMAQLADINLLAQERDTFVGRRPIRVSSGRQDVPLRVTPT